MIFQQFLDPRPGVPPMSSGEWAMRRPETTGGQSSRPRQGTR